ncbi:hypothetical protein E4U46_005158 [Claviceps purpurea]|nr:hypothetical protein E4U46_005158 [Claviceps purpurea]
MLNLQSKPNAKAQVQILSEKMVIFNCIRLIQGPHVLSPLSRRKAKDDQEPEQTPSEFSLGVTRAISSIMGLELMNVNSERNDRLWLYKEL